MSRELQPDSNSVAELAARVAGRVPGADEELVRRYSKGIEIIISQSIDNRSVVEDVRQDTLRIAIEKIRRGELQDPERLSGFVCSIARNLAISYHRRPQRRESNELNASIVADAAPTHLDSLLADEQAALVRAILAGLHPPRDREILHRYYFAEESKEQICAELGLSSLHFNRVLYRAKERYRELYLKRRNHSHGGIPRHNAAPE